MSLLSNSELFAGIDTPAFIYDESRILQSADVVEYIKAETGCKILFPLKAFCLRDALPLLSLNNDGFSASSLFEARIAREVVGNKKLVHITTPGFKSTEISAISELCDLISFNSLSQLARFASDISSRTSCGLRLNPQKSFVKDNRYNPCRKHSKLGVPMSTLNELLNNGFTPPKALRGLHFHTNCESTNFEHLLETVQYICELILVLLPNIGWINLGGGYLFDEDSDLEKLVEAISLLKDRYYLEVFFEPGKGIVGNAGYILSKVVDLFESDGRSIAMILMENQANGSSL